MIKIKCAKKLKLRRMKRKQKLTKLEKSKKKVSFAKMSVDEYFDDEVEYEFEHTFDSDYEDVYPKTKKAWVSLFH